MSIKKKIYNVLVAKHPPIRRLYVKYKAQGKSPAKRAVYLFKLNFSYHILRDKRLAAYGRASARPYCGGSESALSFTISPEELANRLSEFEAVSFDIFDTLILRPFASPTDLFHIVGAEAGLLNFASVREYCERQARELKFQQEKNHEIDIDDIYEYMEKYGGSSFASAKENELEAEMQLCYADPYMKRVWQLLRERGTELYVISDMYLKGEFLERLLVKNGFEGFKKLLVSNEYKCSKYDGTLYREARKIIGNKRTAHVGDNSRSDIEKSREQGFTPFWRRNPNDFGNAFRPLCGSKMVGSAYSGIVNGKLHCGSEVFPLLYEYGYGYSGIFVLGYCNFIRKIFLETGADKILFLARDGELLKRVYDRLYPEDITEYFLWSRLAAAKLCFEENTLDFIRRFVYHKCSGEFTAAEILEQMELGELADGFPQPDIRITDGNYKELAKYIIDNRERVINAYGDQAEGAKKYFSEKLSSCKRVLTVDVGWAGSGGNAIGLLAKRWGIDVEVIGAVAGTNDSFSEQPDASEALLQSEKMYSYCFSQRHNRDIYLAHDAAAGHNAYFELLLGSASPSLKGFSADGTPVFSENEKGNAENTRLIHKGAEDFCSDYVRAFEKYPYMLDISGSDAYMPFMAAIQAGGGYFKAALGNCSFNLGVGTKDNTIKDQL